MYVKYEIEQYQHDNIEQHIDIGNERFDNVIEIIFQFCNEVQLFHYVQIQNQFKV